MVLQCRAQPDSIKVCEFEQTYWIVNESKNIRPYGIILVLDENVSRIEKLNTAYERFTYQGQQNEEVKIKDY